MLHLIISFTKFSMKKNVENHFYTFPNLVSFHSLCTLLSIFFFALSRLKMSHSTGSFRILSDFVGGYHVIQVIYHFKVTSHGHADTTCITGSICNSDLKVSQVNNKMQSTVPQKNRLQSTVPQVNNKMQSTVSQMNNTMQSTVPQKSRLQSTVPQVNNNIQLTVSQVNNKMQLTVSQVNNKTQSVI